MYGVVANHHVLETGQGRALGGAKTPVTRRSTRTYRLSAALDPAFPNQSSSDLSDFQWPSTSREGEREVARAAGGGMEKWAKHNESALTADTPLPLPMPFPGTQPLSQKEVDAMMSCDPELEYCKDPLYQWTSKCSRCQGTGEVSFYRKRGKEVISKCIACVGIGYVERISMNADKVDDSDLS